MTGFLDALPAALAAALAAWAVCAAVVLAIYVASSAAEAADLAAAAARAAAPGMWFVPALLFLSAGAAPAAAAGLALAANAARQLFSGAVPDRYPGAAPRPRAARLFQVIVERPPRRALPLLGAAALELAVVGVLGGNLLLAALACAAAAALWTRSAVARGAARPRPAPPARDTLLAVLATLLFVVALASAQLAAQGRAAGGLYDTARSVAARLVHAYREPSAAPAQHARAAAPRQIGHTPGDAPPDAVPGVMLVPPPPRNGRLRLARAGAAPTTPGGGFGAVSQPVHIPFTGEYQLFAASTGSLASGSPIYRGSPLDFEYKTVAGTPVETVAWQPLDALIDFRQVGAVQVVLLARETPPGNAALQLVCGGRLKEIGIQFFGLLGDQDETLEYEVPPLTAAERVTALRMVFHRDPRQSSYSARLAIRGWTLVPRPRPTSQPR